jgi:hypothetical protein
VALRASFLQFQEQESSNTGNLRAASDAEVRKTGRSPQASIRHASRAGDPGVAVKIGRYFVVVLGSGPATAVVLRLVWPDFLSQRHPRESDEQAPSLRFLLVPRIV